MSILSFNDSIKYQLNMQTNGLTDSEKYNNSYLHSNDIEMSGYNKNSNLINV